jgi:uncharacterized protein YbbC (DUF1343 family)
MNSQLISHAQKTQITTQKVHKKQTLLKTGAERTALYTHLLKGKNIAIVANQTSIIPKILK